MPGPMQLDAPPTQPPEVAGQMGKPSGAPFAGVGQQIASQNEPTANGAVIAAWQACEKVLNNISKMSPQMAPFVQRAISVMKAGLENMAGASPAASSAQPPTGPEQGATPPKQAGPFPG